MGDSVQRQEGNPPQQHSFSSMSIAIPSSSSSSSSSIVPSTPFLPTASKSKSSIHHHHHPQSSSNTQSNTSLKNQYQHIYYSTPLSASAGPAAKFATPSSISSTGGIAPNSTNSNNSQTASSSSYNGNYSILESPFPTTQQLPHAQWTTPSYNSSSSYNQHGSDAFSINSVSPPGPYLGRLTSTGQGKYLSYIEPMTHENSSTESFFHSSSDDSRFYRGHSQQTSEESCIYPGASNSTSFQAAASSNASAFPAISSDVTNTSSSHVQTTGNASQPSCFHAAARPASVGGAESSPIEQNLPYQQSKYRQAFSFDDLQYMIPTLSSANQAQASVSPTSAYRPFYESYAHETQRASPTNSNLNAIMHRQDQLPSTGDVYSTSSSLQNHPMLMGSMHTASIQKLAFTLGPLATESHASYQPHAREDSSFSSSSAGSDLDPLLRQDVHHDGKPKRPLNAFMIYSRHRRPALQKERPDLKVRETAGVLAEEWRNLDVPTKADFQDKARVVKETFHRTYPDYVYSRRANGARSKRKVKSSTPSVPKAGPRKLASAGGTPLRDSDDSAFSPGYTSSASSTSSFNFRSKGFSPMDAAFKRPQTGLSQMSHHSDNELSAMPASTSSGGRDSPTRLPQGPHAARPLAGTPVDPVMMDYMLRESSTVSSSSTFTQSDSSSSSVRYPSVFQGSPEAPSMPPYMAPPSTWGEMRSPTTMHAGYYSSSPTSETAHPFFSTGQTSMHRPALQRQGQTAPAASQHSWNQAVGSSSVSYTGDQSSLPLQRARPGSPAVFPGQQQSTNCGFVEYDAKNAHEQSFRRPMTPNPKLSRSNGGAQAPPPASFHQQPSSQAPSAPLRLPSLSSLELGLLSGPTSTTPSKSTSAGRPPSQASSDHSAMQT